MSARLIKKLLERAKKAEVSPVMTIVAGGETYNGVIMDLDAANGFVELHDNAYGNNTFIVLDKISAVKPKVAL